MHPRLRATLPALALLALTLLAYLPALRAGFIWDDDLHVTANPTLTTSWRGLYDIWFGLFRHATCQYYPLTFTVFWLEYQLWGLNPFGFHLVNILLHALNATLLYRLLLPPNPQIPESPNPRTPKSPNPQIALLCAALFAVHPVNVMSVAWVTELKNNLAGCLMLLALQTYLRQSRVTGHQSPVPPPQFPVSSFQSPVSPLPTLHSPLPTPPAQCCTGRGLAPPRGGHFPPLPLLLFTLAMLAKTASAVLIPGLALLLWWRKPTFRARDLLPLLPFAVIAAVLVAVTVHVEQGRVWGADPRPVLSTLERLLLAARAFWAYLWHLLWPLKLSFTYPAWTVDPRAPLAYLPLLALLALFTSLWHLRPRIGRAPFAAALYFFLAAPALVLFQTMYMMRYTPIADHWQYFASPPLFALAATAAARGKSRSPSPITAHCSPITAHGSLITVLILLLAALTWRQCLMYRNAETLWLATLERNPRSWLAANNLGTLYETQGRFDAAHMAYEAALAADPGFAETHSNLGALAYRRGDRPAAERHLRDALAINSAHVQAHVNLAIVLADTGARAEALEHVAMAETLKPDGVDVRYACGFVCRKLGQRDEAIRHFRAVLRLAPAHPAATQALQPLLP